MTHPVSYFIRKHVALQLALSDYLKCTYLKKGDTSRELAQLAQSWHTRNYTQGRLFCKLLSSLPS